jgi:hypothetical protein
MSLRTREGSDAPRRSRPGRTMVTTGGSGGIPRLEIHEPKVDFPHLKTQAQILRSMSTKQRRAFDRATKSQRRRMLRQNGGRR